MSEKVQFSSTDNVMIRAEKIWRALGFVNDRMGAVPMMAGYLAMYRELDDNMRAIEQQKKGTPNAD